MKITNRSLFTYTLFASLLCILGVTVYQVAGPARGESLGALFSIAQDVIAESGGSDGADEPQVETLIINDSPASRDLQMNIQGLSELWTGDAGMALLDVPNFKWVFGSAPTSAAMLAGFYDRTSLPNVYTGPTDAGVIPLTEDDDWTEWSDGTAVFPSNPLVASRQGTDGLTSRGTIDDYWIEMDSTQPDPFITNGWEEHSYGTAVGDYMRTSQSSYGLADGSTYINFWPEGSPLTCSLMASNGYPDGLLGVASFFAARGYGVTDCYTQLVDTQGAADGFTYNDFKAEIMAGHPVLIHLKYGDHAQTMLGIGFDESITNTILVNTSFGASGVPIEWGGDWSTFTLHSVSVIHPTADVQPCYALSLSYNGDGSNITAVPSNSPGCDAGKYHPYELINLTAHPAGGSGVAYWQGTSSNFTRDLKKSIVMPVSAKSVSVVYQAEPTINVCVPAMTIGLGDSHANLPTEPGWKDQVNFYPTWRYLLDGKEFAYTFSTTFTGDVDVYLTNLPTGVEMDLFLIEDEGGVCRSENTLAAADNLITYAFEPGKTYYIVVDGDQSGSGGYTLNIDSNDDFATPKEFFDVPMWLTKDTFGATHSAGDPSFASCGRADGLASVWYAFKPAEDGETTFDTFGSSYNTMLGIWRQTPGGLEEIACNNNAQGKLQSQVNLKYLAGETYLLGIAQDSEVETGGSMKLHATSFADVPGDHNLWRYVEGFYDKGITSGCDVNPFRYCPSRSVTRAEMAVFVLRALHVDELPYTPAPAEPGVFADVPAPGKDWMQPWIEEFYEIGITTGCAAGPLRYCPERNVTRGEMAVFLLRAMHKDELPYTPSPSPDKVDIFVDVPASNWMKPWIEEFYEVGITTGCGGSIPTGDLRYCPERPVNRAEMATFIDRVFEFEQLP